MISSRPTSDLFRTRTHPHAWLALPAIIILFAACGARTAGEPAGTGSSTLDEARGAHGAADLARAIDLYSVVAQQPATPQDARDAKLGIAACLFSQRDFDGAADAFLAFAKQYPSDVFGTVAIVQAGNVRLEQGRLDDAEALYDRASSEGDTGTGDAYLWISWQELGKGRVLTARGKYAEGAAFLVRAIGAASEARVTELAQGSLTQCTDALKAAGQTRAAQAWAAEAKLAEASRYVTQADWARAEPILHQALETLEAAGSLKQAHQLLAVCQAGQARTARIKLAESYEDSGDIEKGVETWKLEAVSAPDTDHAVRAVDRIDKLYAGRTVAATEALQALAAGHPDTKLAAAAALAAGRRLLARGKTSEASPLLQVALKLADKVPAVKAPIADVVSAQASEANALERGGPQQWPAAIARWKLVSALETRPIPRGDALVNRGGLLRAIGDYQGARADLSVILSDPVMKADRPLFEKARLTTMLCYRGERNYTVAAALCKEIMDDPVDVAKYKPMVAKIVEWMAQEATTASTPKGGGL